MAQHPRIQDGSGFASRVWIQSLDPGWIQDLDPGFGSRACSTWDRLSSEVPSNPQQAVIPSLHHFKSGLLSPVCVLEQQGVKEEEQHIK